MVYAKMVHMALALRLELVERGELGSHKREYGLLLIAKIEEATIVGTQQVDYGELEGIKVLHLVNLNPRIPLIFIAIAKGIVGKLQQVLEVEQAILPLVSDISVRETRLGKQLRGLIPHALRKHWLANEVEVEIGMIVKVNHERGIERLAYGLCQLLHGSDILRRDTFGMSAQLTRHAMHDAVHEMREEHDLRMRPFLIEITPYDILILVKVLGENAVNGVVIYDGALCRHDIVGEKES